MDWLPNRVSHQRRLYLLWQGGKVWRIKKKETRKVQVTLQLNKSVSDHPKPSSPNPDPHDVPALLFSSASELVEEVEMECE